jgi:hypothetical protein
VPPAAGAPRTAARASGDRGGGGARPGARGDLPVPGGRVAGRHQHPSRAGRRAGERTVRRRLAATGAAALAVVVALGSVAVLLSRDALPGGALYEVKRVAETAGLAVTLHDGTRARRSLELATTRLGEIEQLVAADPDGAAGPGGPDPALLRAAIREFEALTGEGSRAVLGGGQAAGPGAAELGAWAAEQAGRLSALRPALPPGALGEADLSAILLERVVERTAALAGRASCASVISGAVDDLGPLPARGSCRPRLEPAGPG